jgi:hypothetical protein
MDALSALFQAILGQLFKDNPKIAIFAIQQALIGLGEDAWNAFSSWYEERRQEGWPEVPEFQPVPLPMPQNGPSDTPPEP